ncbi:squalene/phytoene synthase family protein [Klugiella xanthotipulae]|uniref:Phytoene/squalene synthetase n=1 Tax=Klugiella xanthotipulae TaxID=244735 RepID=A0A543HYS1_9MICO|nr:squalene/phytoene synthase family protein [Klugiella xanthotipulae]TQM63482.1 phytoene/squalene synthetase [Klugiella xanthotipulae]
MVVRTGLDLYTEVAARNSRTVLRQYSTSFGVASSLLPRLTRRDIAQVYALVRIADEIVDGPAAASGLTVAAQCELLDALERETYAAVSSGFSSNLVVHSFAQTARRAGIGRDLIEPFFASMRADLTCVAHDTASIRAYIYGSAEVVGLMCVAVFLANSPTGVRTEAERAVIDEGARHLGAAFQKVNFLRDLAADVDGLGRNYFPGVDVEHLSESDKKVIIDDIDNDVRIARESIPLLPRPCQSAVLLATELFAGLAARLRRAPAATLLTTRVRLSTPVKAAVAARVLVGAPARRWQR